MPHRAPSHRPSRPSRAKKHDQRPSACKRGYGHKWRTARENWLKLHPLCVHCKGVGILTAATEVDHVRAHGGDMALFWDKDNWQSLCKSCHSKKTYEEDGGLGHNA